MKKITITLFLIMFISLSLFSQKRGSVTWMSLSAKGGFGSTLLMHQESLSDGNVAYQYFSPAYFVGGRFGLTFGNYIGVSSELMYQAFSQKYDITTANSINYQKQTNLAALEFDVLFRFTALTGIYLELGPKFTQLKNIKQTTTGVDLPELNPIQFYEEKWTNIIFGIGFMPFRTDRLEISVGVRGAYGFKSIISDDNYYVVRDGVYSPNYLDPITNPITFQAVVEVNYIFGYFGIANCGKFKMKLFQ